MAEEKKKRRAATSASYSITMRLHTERRPGGGRPGRHRHRVRRRHRDRARRRRVPSRPPRGGRDLLGDRQRARRRDRRRGPGPRRASPSTRSPTAPSCCTSAARSRSPRRSRCAPATTCRWPTRPGVGRVSLALAEHPEDVPRLTDQGQQRRGGHRRLRGARAGQHRPRRGPAGDGGQGRAVQAVRRHRRLADLPRHPGHRPDRRRRRGDRAGLRRHQPRGHRRAPLLRDRGAAARARWTSRSSTTTSTAPRSSCSPRSPTRCAASARSSSRPRSWWPAPAPRVRRS